MLPAPPVGGAKFLRVWDGRTLATLFELVRTTMPANNPGYLDDQELVDVIAWMLAVSDLPAGPDELEPALAKLARTVIDVNTRSAATEESSR